MCSCRGLLNTRSTFAWLPALRVPLPREEAKEAAASGLPGARQCLRAQLPPALIVFTDLDRRRYKSNQD